MDFYIDFLTHGHAQLNAQKISIFTEDMDVLAVVVNCLLNGEDVGNGHLIGDYDDDEITARNTSFFIKKTLQQLKKNSWQKDLKVLCSGENAEFRFFSALRKLRVAA